VQLLGKEGFVTCTDTTDPEQEATAELYRDLTNGALDQTATEKQEKTEQGKTQLHVYRHPIYLEVPIQPEAGPDTNEVFPRSKVLLAMLTSGASEEKEPHFYYKNRELNNDKTLEDNQVPLHANLRLHFEQPSSIKVRITQLLEQTITIQVDRNSTILQLVRT
jgi:hypothetical protein